MHSDLAENTPSILYGEGDRIKLLQKMLEALGDPDQAFKIVHLAGTNGKGSTSTMMAAVLKAHNLRTGLFTSPHLFTERESIQVNGTLISPKEFKASLYQVHQAALLLGLKPEEDLSQFETTFLIAMVYFADLACDYVVLECGLGGLLDATNAITFSDYAIFTKIGLDHIDLLGDNLAEIVETKAGILRPNQKAVVGPFQKEGVEEQLETLAKAKGADLIKADLSLVESASPQVYQIHLPNQPVFEVKLGLKGSFQKENLTTVMTWYADWLQDQKEVPAVERVQQALKDVSLAGRFEKVQSDPLVILDAAHNVDAMQQFVHSVKELYPQQQVTVICGFLKDKDVLEIVDELKQLPADFLLTQPDHPERALEIDKLAEIFKDQEIAVQAFEKPQEALVYAQKELKAPIFVVGSFYLIKTVRSEFNFHAEENKPATNKKFADQ